jgi:hypothetical protein
LTFLDQYDKIASEVKHMADIEYMTASQVRKELGITKEALRQLLAKKLAWIPSPTDGRLKLIKRADFEEYRKEIAGMPRAMSKEEVLRESYEALFIAWKRKCLYGHLPKGEEIMEEVFEASMNYASDRSNWSEEERNTEVRQLKAKAAEEAMVEREHPTV